jgi:hypothetical protein
MARGIKDLQLRRAIQEHEEVFSRRQARHLHALNSYSGATWAGFLAEAISTSEVDGTLWFVTIIDDDWILGTNPVEPSPDDLKGLLVRMRRITGLRLRGVPYVLQADFAVRREVGDFRPSVDVHWHGLVWADARQIGALRSKFRANRRGAAGFQARAVYHLPGALAYLTKDTRLGYVTVRNRAFQPESSGGKGWFHHRISLQSRHRQLLLGLVGDLTKPELCSASGAGRGVLQEAKRLAREGGYGSSPVTARVITFRRRPRRR